MSLVIYFMVSSNEMEHFNVKDGVKCARDSSLKKDIAMHMN